MAQWLRRLDEHPRSRDALVASIWLMLGLAALQFGGVALWREAAVLSTNDFTFLLLLVAMTAVALRRSTHPILALAAGSVITIVDMMFGGSLGVILIFTDLLYAAFKYGSDRGVRAVLWSMLGVAILTIVVLLVWLRDDVMAVVIAAQWALIVFFASAWGWTVRSERLRTRTLLAERHARSTQQLRRRIAHDLHDLVANQIAVAGLHIEAAKLQVSGAGDIRSEVERSLDKAAHGSVEADRQLRRMIRVLHAIDAIDERSDATSGELIDRAVVDLERAVPAPRTVQWADGGVPGLRTLLAGQPVPHVRSMLRVLSELVANAVKHGTGTITISVEMAARAIVVTNTALRHASRRPGSGIGTVGAALLLEGTGAQVTSGADGNESDWRATIHVPKERTD